MPSSTKIITSENFFCERKPYIPVLRTKLLNIASLVLNGALIDHSCVIIKSVNLGFFNKTAILQMLRLYLYVYSVFQV